MEATLAPVTATADTSSGMAASQPAPQSDAVFKSIQPAKDPTTTASEFDLEVEPAGLSSEPGNVQHAWQVLRNATKGASGHSMGKNVPAVMLTVIKRVTTRVGEDGKGLGEGDEEKAVRQLLPYFKRFYPRHPALPEVVVQTNTEAETDDNASEQHPPLVEMHESSASNTRTQPSPTQTQTQTQDRAGSVVGVGDGSGSGSGGGGGGCGGGGGGDTEAAQAVASIVFRSMGGSNRFEGRGSFNAMKSDPDHDDYKKRKILTYGTGSQFLVPYHDNRLPGKNRFKFIIKREHVTGLQNRRMNSFTQRAAKGHEHELVAGVMYEKNARFVKPNLVQAALSAETCELSTLYT